MAGEESEGTDGIAAPLAEAPRPRSGPGAGPDALSGVVLVRSGDAPAIDTVPTGSSRCAPPARGCAIRCDQHTTGSASPGAVRVPRSRCKAAAPPRTPAGWRRSLLAVIAVSRFPAPCSSRATRCHGQIERTRTCRRDDE